MNFKMTQEKAIEIIKQYNSSIIDLRPNGIVQPNTILKYSGGMVKYAHFVYIQGVIEAENLTDELAKAFIQSYAQIDSLFVDPSDVERINLQYREYISSLKSGIIPDFKIPNYGGELHASNEFYEFINEYLWGLGKEKLNIKTNRALFIYFLENELREEKDVKKLLELAIDGSILNVLPYEK